MTGGRNAYHRQELWAKGHRYCAYCGLRLIIEQNHIKTMTVDHIVPRCKGGTTQKSNITSACKLCNHLKDKQVKLLNFDTKTGQKITRPKVEKTS